MYHPCCSLQGEEVDVWDVEAQRFYYRGVGSAMVHRQWQKGWLIFPANLFTAKELRGALADQPSASALHTSADSAWP